MDIFAVLNLVGGLVLFLYGMDTMGKGLEKLAGGRLEGIFEKLTSNPIKAVLLGAGVTAVIQSSSATTVMLVGFVNSGIMKLNQAIGIIFGANVGTTVTSWILSLTGIEGDNVIVNLLKPSSFTPVLALIGIILYMFSKNGHKKDIGVILLGFAILMFGMDTMSAAVAPLKDSQDFANILLMFQNPILGVLAGTFLTAVIQSSSASVGILQALSATGTIKFGAAFPIILGQNIGTCVTALISSVGTSKNAKRVAIVHLYFNIIGAIIFMIGFYGLNAVLDFSFLDDTVNTVQIALTHTIFNLGATIILLPFSKGLEKLAYLTIRDGKGSEEQKSDSPAPQLDDRFLQSPAFAIAQCKTQTCNMANLVRENMFLAMKVVNKYDKKLCEEIDAKEDIVDLYEDRLGTYLVKLSSKELNVKDSVTASVMLHSIGDFERISDHAKNISKVAREMNDKGITFSKKAKAELNVLFNAVTDILNLTVDAFVEQDLRKAGDVEPLEEVIDRIRKKLKSRHIKRLQKGVCTIELGFIFSDLLTNLERVSDHCSNIAVCIIQADDENFDTHEYVQELKSQNEKFVREVEMYMGKYALPKKN